MTTWNVFWGEHAYLLLWAVGILAAIIGLTSAALWKMLRFIWTGQQTQVTSCLQSIKSEIEEVVREARICQNTLPERFAARMDTASSIARLFQRQDELREKLPNEYMPRRDLERSFTDIKEQIRECHVRMEEIKRGIDWLKRANGNVK